MQATTSRPFVRARPFGRSLTVGAAAAAAFVFASMQADAQTKLTIGTAKDPNLSAQIVIARDKGFFEKAGLDAEISFFPSGGDLMAAFVGGSVSMGTAGATPTTTLRSRPFPIVIVSRVSDISGAQQLLVKKDVDSLEALEGKKIGMLSGTASEALFNSIVEGYGLDASKFEKVNMGPTEMLQGFVQGTVDAVALWEPHSTRAREAGDGKTLVSGTHSFIPGSEGEKRVYGDHAVLFTSEDFLAQQPETVKQALTALAMASDFIEQNRDEAVAILSAEFGLTPEQLSAIVDVNRFTLSLDDQMADDMNRLAQFLAGLGKIVQNVDVREWIRPDLLREIRPELVKLGS